MDASSKNFRYLMLLLVIIIFLFVIAALIILFFKDNKLLINSEDVILKSESNTIIIKSLITANDEFGKTISDDNGGYYGYLEFEVENTTDDVRNYQLFLDKSDVSSNDISDEYIKLYLTDSEDNYDSKKFDNMIPSYNDLFYLSDMPGKKLLYSGILSGNSLEKFKLRVWLSDSYNINDDSSFGFVVSVRAV